ncbi:phage major capsid protein [Micromonospora tulbaghiae]|uniref:phage major capsid protein n=1 Tax=Micromonospora tulbaghiae TaxID=479978 RepID=UPI0033FDC084
MTHARTLSPVIGYRRDGRPIHLVRGAAPDHIPTLTELRERFTDAPDALAEACAAAADLHEAAMRSLDAEAAGQPLNASQQRRWDAHTSASAELRTVVAQRRMSRASESRARWGAEVGSGLDSSPTTPGGELRSRAMRVVDGLHRSNDLPAHAAERVERMLSAGREDEQNLAARWAVAAGAPEYRSAFTKLCADPMRGHMLWTAQEQAAYQRAEQVRAAMSLTDANGGYMVPLTLDPAIILTNDGSVNPLRRISRVVQTVTDTWQGVTSAGATAEWKAEGAQAADGSPAVAPAPIPVHFGDVNVTYSYEVGMDARNFLSELERVIVDAADNLMAAAYTTGSGSGQPTGVITALAGTASEINTTGTEAINAADPYTLQNALPPRFQARAQWCANLGIINGYAQMETANGALKFPGLHETPPTLLRKPMNELSNMDGSINPAATASNFVLLYGDFQNFVIVDRVGTTLEILPAYGANGRPTGQRHAFLYFRTGSDVVVDNAFRMLDVPTTA